MRRIIIAFLLSSTLAYANNVDDILNDAADRHGVSRALVHAVAMVESTKRCGINSGPHKGIMQVSRGAAREVGVSWPPKDCWSEVEMGVKYLKLALERAHNDCQAATLYNAGINASLHCSAYGRKVMKEMK